MTWFVSRETDLIKPKSAICFLQVSLDPGERYSCCENISNLRQHLWHMLAASLRRSQSRRLRNGKNFLECKDFLHLQTGENRSKNTPSLLKIQGTGLCSCGLLYCSTVRLLSRNRISSQWTRHYCFWQPLFLVFPLYFARYTDPHVPQPNLFSFSKSFHSNFGNSGSFFAFLFRLVGILKLAAILFHLTRREKPWERGCHFGQILARNCGPIVRVLLIESSPRFTNLSPVCVLPVQSAFYYMPSN